ncbi:MAG: AMP-binding protein [Proteobacteria bacterium]|nr:AMP-binding protein [Pseudomonadota bacterium]
MPGKMAKLPIFQCFRYRTIDPDEKKFIFVNADGSDETVTMGDIFTQTNRISHALIKAGIGKGDAVTLLMRNHPEFLYSLFAAMSIGAIAVPVDPRSKGEKLLFQINNTQSKGIILSDEFLDNLKDIENGLKGARIVGVLYKKHHGIPVHDTYPSLNQILLNESPDLPDKVVPFNPKNPVQIIHTSGTTGDPKGVVLKGDRLRAYGILNRMIWKYKKGDVPYTGLSMTHGNAQSVTVFPILSKKHVHGVIGEKFTKSMIWDICRKYGCTTFSLLGGMMAGIFNEIPRPDDADNPVRTVISAGTPKAIWEDFEARFKVNIFEWYAAVEGGVAYKKAGKGPVGSFGKPNPLMYRMKIVDDNDREMPPNTQGELICKMTFGKTNVTYFGKKKASDDKTRGGWLRTGDICHRDKNGYLFFDFRVGGGLRRQGDFVQPDVIEKIIGTEESVSEVCVYGIPAESGAPGESDIVAAIAPFPGKTLDMVQIRQRCINTLERNAVPSYLQIVPEIPKTISEKALSRVLKDSFSPDADNVIKL